MPKRFKVGDKVKFYQKTEKPYCVTDGTNGVIIRVESPRDICWDYLVSFEGNRGFSANVDGVYYPCCQYVVDEDLEPRKKEKSKFKMNIVLFRKGNTVFAQLHQGKSVVLSAAAKCSPGDDFNFLVGSQIALQRLVQKISGDETKYCLPKELCLDDLFIY